VPRVVEVIEDDPNRYHTCIRGARRVIADLDKNLRGNHHRRAPGECEQPEADDVEEVPITIHGRRRLQREDVLSLR
jgi:hypothetical protein